MGVRWTYIHVLLHVHILTKVWDQKWCDCDKLTMPHIHCHVSMKVFKGSGGEMESKVDINWCTDACTHSKHSLGPEIGWLWQTYNATLGHPCLHETVQRVWSRYRQSGGHKSMYWWIYTFQNWCCTRSGMTATHTFTPIFPCSYTYGMEQNSELRLAYIHVLMHVHIVNKVWEKKWDDCNIHSATHWHPCFHA